MTIWVTGFPERSGWKPSAETARVAGLKGRNGSEHPPGAVFAALRQYAEAKPSSELKAPGQPLRAPLGIGNAVVVPA